MVDSRYENACFNFKFTILLAHFFLVTYTLLSFLSLKGNNEEELPEEILAVTRLGHMDLAKAKRVDGLETIPHVASIEYLSGIDAIASDDESVRKGSKESTASEFERYDDITELCESPSPMKGVYDA